jgi:uncharacterized protein
MVEVPQPSPPAERLEAVDILRGLALFGVMAVNVVMGFRISVFDRYFADDAPAWSLDGIVSLLLSFLVGGKALTIFTLLFGAGLAIQAERLRHTENALVLLLRRLAVLLAIGLVHLLLIWNGDILTAYAVAGFIVLPFLFGSTRLLARGALCFFGVHLLLLMFLPHPTPDTKWLNDYFVAARTTHWTGAIVDVVAFNLRGLSYVALWHLYALPRTLALFLLGALAWRSDILRDPGAHRGLLKVAAWVGCAGGVVLAIAATAIMGSDIPPVAYVLGEGSVTSLALGYGAAVLVVATNPRGQRWLAWAAPVGRMAFTNYLAQSAIFAFVFFGYGLGLFGRIGAAVTLLFGMVVYALQAIASAYWLRRHRFGPMEWLWRTVMYGTRQPWAGGRVDPTPPPSAPRPTDRS